MSQLQSKQIAKLLTARIAIAALAFPAAATMDVSAAVTAAAASAGNAGAAVPVRVGSASAEGFITTGTKNIVDVAVSASGAKLADGAGNEVYGRLTEAAGVYTLSLFSLVAGVETAYTAAAQSIDVTMPYVFTFEHLPFDALTAVTSSFVANDPAGASSNTQIERVAVTGVNTLTALSVAYAGAGEFELRVNGQVIDIKDSPVPFTVAGTAVTWNATNAGFSLAVTDNVVARFSKA